MVEAEKKKEVVRPNLKAMVLRRRRGDREIVEVWMDGRIECRVLRRSRGIVEIAEVEVCAEVEVWMGWRMECRVCLLYTSPSPRDRG